MNTGEKNVGTWLLNGNMEVSLLLILLMTVLWVITKFQNMPTWVLKFRNFYMMVIWRALPWNLLKKFPHHVISCLTHSQFRSWHCESHSVCLFVLGLNSFFFFNLFFWNRFFLQCCVDFCHTTMQISHNYTYIPIVPSLLTYSHPVLPGHHRARDWAPCATQQLPTSSPSYAWQCVYVAAAFSTLSLPHWA